jgi:hypothetical protein
MTLFRTPRHRLERAANFPPRTKPVEGEGYIFFQGPTPKTGKQGLSDFFSEENKADITATSVPLPLYIFGGLSAVLSLWLLVTLIID